MSLGLQKQNKFRFTFLFCFFAAAVILVPQVLANKGLFLYAGDFNTQQIAFYTYCGKFVRQGGGSWSWVTDLGGSFLNSYSFYLVGSPFWWLSLLIPSAVMPYCMVPMLCLKFAVAGGGAYLWARRYVRDVNYAVVAGVLYALSGWAIYNIFFNHFIDVMALFGYLLWALDDAVYDGKRGKFALLVALNLLNNYFFFVGQVVFLALYFLCMLAGRRYRLTLPRFGLLAFESLLGCAMGCVLLIPAMLSLANNPRTVNFASGYDLLLYSHSQQYGAILLSLFFPPEPSYYTSVFDEGIIKWTSMTAWLPLAGVSGAVAWCRTKGGAFAHLLITCLVFALVPVLNSAFYALNSSYYARWFYMPTLILCLTTVLAAEDSKIDIPRKGIVPTLVCTLAFAVFAVVPVHDEETGWSFGVVTHQPLFWARMAIAAGGLLIFAVLLHRFRKSPLLPRRLLAGVTAFGCLAGLICTEVGKFDQYYGDADYADRLLTDAPSIEWPDDGWWRIDSYGTFDNLGLWAGKSSLQFFNSTVEPSILEFYPSVGVTRDVASRPEVDKYELRGLLSVKYTLCDADSTEEFLEKADEGWLEVSRQGGYVIYENQNYVPMGLVYSHYVTQQQFDDTTRNNRAALLMKAVVLSDEQIEQVGDMLTELPQADLKASRNYKTYCENAAELRQKAASSFETDNYGFTSTITLDAANLVVFTVPYSDGFTAWVNGEETPVLKVDNGLCAVVCPAGTDTIRFTYHTPGLRISLCLSGAGVVVFAGYLVWIRKKKESFI